MKNNDTFNGASSYCRSYEAKLVVARSREVRQMLMREAGSLTNFDRFYIGLTRNNDNRWEWSDGRALSNEQNWYEVPTNSQMFCAEMNRRSGRWIANNCDSSLPYVCEKGLYLLDILLFSCILYSLTNEFKLCAGNA